MISLRKRVYCRFHVGELEAKHVPNPNPNHNPNPMSIRFRRVRSIDEHASSTDGAVTKILLGNKSDRTEQRAVSEAKGQSTADEHNMPVRLTSSEISDTTPLFSLLALRDISMYRTAHRRGLLCHGTLRHAHVRSTPSPLHCHSPVQSHSLQRETLLFPFLWLLLTHNHTFPSLSLSIFPCTICMTINSKLQ